MGVWDDYVRPGPVPVGTLVYFGANPHWDPTCEGRVLGEPAPERGHEKQATETCSVCGGNRACDDRSVPDPIREFETVVHVCAGCLRSSHDALIAEVAARQEARERQEEIRVDSNRAKYDAANGNSTGEGGDEDRTRPSPVAAP